MSATSPLNDGALDEAGPLSESSRPTEPRSWSIPPAAGFAPLSTLELEELEELEERAGQHFDFHDTIPAPPWFDDAGLAEFELQALRSPQALPAL